MMRGWAGKPILGSSFLSHGWCGPLRRRLKIYPYCCWSSFRFNIALPKNEAHDAKSDTEISHLLFLIYFLSQHRAFEKGSGWCRPPFFWDLNSTLRFFDLLNVSTSRFRKTDYAILGHSSFFFELWPPLSTLDRSPGPGAGYRPHPNTEHENWLFSVRDPTLVSTSL